MNFKEWLHLTERAFQKPRIPHGKNLPLTPGKHNDFATSAVVPATWTGSGPNWGRFDQLGGVGPRLDLLIPQVKRWDQAIFKPRSIQQNSVNTRSRQKNNCYLSKIRRRSNKRTF